MTGQLSFNNGRVARIQILPKYKLPCLLAVEFSKPSRILYPRASLIQEKENPFHLSICDLTHQSTRQNSQPQNPRRHPRPRRQQSRLYLQRICPQRQLLRPQIQTVPTQLLLHLHPLPPRLHLQRIHLYRRLPIHLRHHRARPSLRQPSQQPRPGLLDPRILAQNRWHVQLEERSLAHARGRLYRDALAAAERDLARAGDADLIGVAPSRAAGDGGAAGSGTPGGLRVLAADDGIDLEGAPGAVFEIAGGGYEDLAGQGAGVD